MRKSKIKRDMRVVEAQLPGCWSKKHGQKEFDVSVFTGSPNLVRRHNVTSDEMLSNAMDILCDKMKVSFGINQKEDLFTVETIPSMYKVYVLMDHINGKDLGTHGLVVGNVWNKILSETDINNVMLSVKFTDKSISIIDEKTDTVVASVTITNIEESDRGKMDQVIIDTLLIEMLGVDDSVSFVCSSSSKGGKGSEESNLTREECILYIYHYVTNLFGFPQTDGEVGLKELSEVLLRSQDNAKVVLYNDMIEFIFLDKYMSLSIFKQEEQVNGIAEEDEFDEDLDNEVESYLNDEKEYSFRLGENMANHLLSMGIELEGIPYGVMKSIERELFNPSTDLDGAIIVTDPTFSVQDLAKNAMMGNYYGVTIDMESEDMVTEDLVSGYSLLDAYGNDEYFEDYQDLIKRREQYIEEGYKYADLDIEIDYK